MGGKHYNSGRISPDTYEQLKPRVLKAARDIFGRANIPREMPGKESYGDVDILVPSEDLNEERLAAFSSTLNTPPPEKASGAHSFLVPLTEAERSSNINPQQTAFQVDIFARTTELMDVTLEFMGDGELGNILSRQLRRWNLQWGMDGLHYVLRDPEDTHDVRFYAAGGMKEALLLLGLSHETWKAGFESEAALFAWVRSSPEFNPEPYLNLRGKSVSRLKERPAMTRFVEEIRRTFPADSPRLEKYPPEQLAGQLGLPGLLRWIEEQRAEQRRKNERRARFSGKVALGVWPQLEGGGARTYMSRLLAEIGTAEQLSEWLSSKSDADVLDHIRAHPPVESELINSEQARLKREKEEQKPSREEREQARQTRIREQQRQNEIAAQKRHLKAQLTQENQSLPLGLESTFLQAEQKLGLPIREHCVVWITGSRSQGLQTEESDTDYIIVHGPALLTAGPVMGLSSQRPEWSPKGENGPDNSMRFIPLWHFSEMLSSGTPDAVMLAHIPPVFASRGSSNFIMELLATATAGRPSERTLQTMIGHASSSLRLMLKRIPELSEWPDTQGLGKRAALHPKYMMHALRMAMLARTLATTGVVSPRLSAEERKVLMTIKSGAVHPSQVAAMIEQTLADLPHRPAVALRPHDENHGRLQGIWKRELQWLWNRSLRTGAASTGSQK